MDRMDDGTLSIAYDCSKWATEPGICAKAVQTGFEQPAQKRLYSLGSAPKQFRQGSDSNALRMHSSIQA
ncbi:hypothetical protein VE01_00123 [Pseudogymnoascus verrucosus]|uniref:Uncharacterized protein n=1 Tax=Pseudogymnoascus verrucosus TaxID=342668 RepID=A0A2P2SXQ8_9PEZI|nr:uncharacterized protein VE01_00123 [Pseudogymnoascus verrucosus]OBU01632.1 hypothetical protein VE01_00123 [Pseudogymnoascus verrucosus]